uniref:XRCC1_N domain-containing protein n=1 Tax=Onchocerca volvulus TaxID=6282 RepID=A0A2K6WJU4_ONCVO
MVGFDRLQDFQDNKGGSAFRQTAKMKFIVSWTDSEPHFEAGTSSNAVILQLEKECQIKSMDSGNEFIALISVLVYKSCELEQNFLTLVS